MRERGVCVCVCVWVRVCEEYVLVSKAKDSKTDIKTRQCIYSHAGGRQQISGHRD